jgi:hypothetical protein
MAASPAVAFSKGKQIIDLFRVEPRKAEIELLGIKLLQFE